MRMTRLLVSALLYTTLCLPLHSQPPSAAITTDPLPDKANPASLQTFLLPSHGSQLNALVYVASGPGPHPTVILLHGFPGNERNLDLAQSIRRAGWNVLFFDYRGSWGSPGDFSFTHSIEDTQSAIAYLRDPANAAKLRSDPANIVLIGHSMGGFMARYVGAHNPAIKAVALISAADMGVDTVEPIPAAAESQAVPRIAAGLASQGMAPLAGCTPESLAKEIFANRADWTPAPLAPMLATRPILVLTSDDGLAPSNDTVTEAIRKAGGKQITTLHLATDHSYSDKRIALQQSILTFLSTLPK